jgi:hypothetical protein
MDAAMATAAPSESLPRPASGGIVAGLTTIPSRLRGQGTGLRPTLRSLAAQTLPLDAIVVVVPLKSMRGVIPSPDAAAVTASDIAGLQHWYQSNIHWPPLVVFRPPDDLGPIMKYVGTAEALQASPGPADTLAARVSSAVIVDDDRAYPPAFVASLAAQAAQAAAKSAGPVVLSQQTALQRLHPKLLSVFGFAGVWVPVPALLQLAVRARALAAQTGGVLPTFAARNDDVLAAILLDKAGVRIQRTAASTPRSTSTDNNQDALSAAAKTTKSLQIMQCHYAYNQPFATTATVVVAVLLALMAALIVVAGVFVARSEKTRRRKISVQG